MMHRRSLLAALPLALLTPRSTPARSLLPLTMQLDWQLSAQFAGLLVAKAQGLYRQQGLAVTLKPAGDDIATPAAVAQLPHTLGCAEQALLLEAQGQGVPVRALAAMLQSSPLALMSRPSAPLKAPQDLVGKRVGLHLDGLKALEFVLAKNGIDPQQVMRVTIPYRDKFDRLVAGQFDAVQCYALDEPLDYARQTGEVPALLKLSDYGFDAYAQVIFAPDALLREAPDAVQAFLIATFQGWEQALADLPATARLLVQTQGGALDDQVNKLEQLIPYVVQADGPIGSLEGDRWHRAIHQLTQASIIDRIPPHTLWQHARLS